MGVRTTLATLMAIHKETILRVVDNTGAKAAKVIGIYGRVGDKARSGQYVTMTIRNADGDKVKKGTIQKGVILETKAPIQRPNGSHVHYTRNTVALISEKGAPMGSRIKSLLPYEFCKPRFKRISMLSPRLF